jgi:15-cis-phytoene synthase
MLDSSFIDRAVPPGSMRFFALQYAEPEQRSALEALFVIDSELRAVVHAAHEVAHTKMQWWQEEIDRLIKGEPRHPATQSLQAAIPNGDFSKLPHILSATSMELARITYQTEAELEGYLQRSGGVLLEIALQPSEQERQHLRQLGGLIRRAETLRDLVFEARTGRVFWPLNELHNKQLTVQHLQSNTPVEATLKMIAAEATKTRDQLQHLNTQLVRPKFRPACVLAQLQSKLLTRIEQANGDVFSKRIELGPFERVWTAWRAARRS